MDIRDSVRIKNVYTKNRIVMPPLACEKADDGRVSPDVRRFYEERCAGGKLGLVITEHCYIAKQGQAGARQLSIAEDKCIEGLTELTEMIKSSGSPVFCQINHAGLRSNSAITGCEVVSASADPERGVRALEPSEIHEITALFAEAALRAKKAGYDGVELHAAHRFLLSQFFSPIYNKRRDGYGCESVQSRLRFTLETVSAVRASVGEDYPIAVRLGACDYMEGGNSISDGVEAAKLLEKAGVDLLDISGGACGTAVPGRNEGRFSDVSKAIKEAVSIPVIVTGGVHSPELAQQLLDHKCADLIGVGSALIANPHWADEVFR